MRSKTELTFFMLIWHRRARSVTDLVDDGPPNGSLHPTEETVSVPAGGGRHAYTHSTVTAPGRRSRVGETP
jgi:hypothetical protein